MCGICGELTFDGVGRYPLKTISRGVIPDAVIDRPKGYFPFLALKHVREPFLDLMRGILRSDACIRRGLYPRAYIDKLLSDPKAYVTRTRGGKLWHLAVLEWWFQVHVDGLVPEGNHV